MDRRVFIHRLQFAFLASTLPVLAVADTADHIANPDTVKITLGEVQPDPDGVGEYQVEASVTNLLKVSILLRGVKAGKFDAKLFAQKKVFGTAVWRDVDLINVRPGQTLNLSGAYKISIPAAAKPASIYEFDFGPKGEVIYSK